MILVKNGPTSSFLSFLRAGIDLDVGVALGLGLGIYTPFLVLFDLMRFVVDTYIFTHCQYISVLVCMINYSAREAFRHLVRKGRR